METKSTEAKPETKAAEGAPEKYEDFKLPDGIELKGDQLTKATELFKGLGLTQAAAQSLVDFHAAQLKAAGEAPMAEYDAMRTEWKSKAEADPEIGPFDGTKALALKVTIGRALDALGDTKLSGEFKSAMNLTGIGDHPAFIKAFAKFAAKFVEGTPTNTNSAKPSPNGQEAPGKAPQSIASAMYPNLPA